MIEAESRMQYKEMFVLIPVQMGKLLSMSELVYQYFKVNLAETARKVIYYSHPNTNAVRMKQVLTKKIMTVCIVRNIRPEIFK